MVSAAVAPNVSAETEQSLIDRIPLELRNRPNWCRFKGLNDKAPRQVDGTYAKSNDKNTWCSFEKAYFAGCLDPELLKVNGGIGFMVEGPIAVVDIDHCILDGKPNDLAKKVLKLCKSYSEISTSGTGIHIFVRGESGTPPNRCKGNGIEFYTKDRFMIVTGNRRGPWPEIREINFTPIIEMMSGKTSVQPPAAPNSGEVDDSSEDMKFLNQQKRLGKTRDEAEIAWLVAFPRYKMNREDYRKRTLDKVFGIKVEALVANALEDDLMSDVQSKPIEWLWEGLIPMNYLTVMAGDSDIGKSTFLYNLAATITTGRAFGNGTPNPLPPSQVYIINVEDRPEDMVKPRLIAAGADCSKIRKFRRQQSGYNFDMGKDLESLRKKLKDHPEIKLAIIDPWSNHMGKKNMNNPQEVRDVLTPLHELAADCNVAVVVVAHDKKVSQDEEVKNRPAGSKALTDVARSVIQVFVDKNKPATTKDKWGVMYQTKCNMTGAKKGLNYRTTQAFITDNGVKIETCKTVFDGEAEESLSSFEQTQTPEARKSRKCETWLREFLCDEEKQVKDILEAGHKLGFSNSTLYNARDAMKIVERKSDAGPKYWSLPVGSK
jgi:hypothetical protein